MGMMINNNQSNVKRIVFYHADQTVAGTLSISTPGKKKPKRLQYNFKEISSQIMMSHTSGSASRIVAKARRKVATLQRNRRNDEYDEKELESAILHAKKMERIARKRMNHLKEEESLKTDSSTNLTELDEEEESSILDALDSEDVLKLSQEEFKELMQEFEESMKKLQARESDDELQTELSGNILEDMNSADLEQLKKKHRCEELREIMEADMKYLKAVFEKLAKEKQSISNGSASAAPGGVSLELNGMEMPLQPVEAPIMTEGGVIDTTV